MNETSLLDFHFLRPLWLLALIPAAIALWALLKMRLNQSSWQQAFDQKLLSHLLQDQQQKNTPWLVPSIGVLWFIAIIAMAGPSWQKLPQPVQKKQDALVILMDMSLSMYAEDETPSRLVMAKRKVADILKQRREGLTALIVYSGDAHVVSPFTDDAQTVEAMIPALSPDIMPSYGSNAVAAGKKALTLMKDAGINKARWLLISDEIRDRDVNALPVLIEDKEITLSILGVGSQDGAPIPNVTEGFLKTQAGNIVIAKLNEDKLQSLAAKTQGRYMHAKIDDSDIRFLLPSSNLNTASNLIESQREFDRWHDSGFWLLILLIPACLLSFRKGWLALLCVFILQPQPSWSFEWQDLWQTKDQQAENALKKGDAAKAAELFERKDKKAQAQFNSGQMQEAEASFKQSLAEKQQNKTANAADYYNHGVSLAHTNKLDDAINAFEKALELNPDMEKAKKNKRIVEEMKKQQKQQEQNQDDQNQNKQNQENKDQNDQNQQNQNNQNSDQEQNSQDQNSESQDSQNQDSKNESSQNKDSENQQSEQQNQKNQQKNQDVSEQKDETSQSKAEQDELKKQKEREEQERQAQQAQEDQNNSEKEKQQAAQAKPMTAKEREQQQAMQQWIRKIPDDPAGLLRNKFQYQYEQNRRQGQLVPDKDQIW